MKLLMVLFWICCSHGNPRRLTVDGLLGGHSGEKIIEVSPCSAML